MNKYLIIILCIIFIALALNFIIIKFIEKNDDKNKLIKVLYQSSKAIIILLISMWLYSKFDLFDLFPGIPEKDIGLNITVHTLFLSLFFSVIEIIISSKLVTIDMCLSNKDSINNLVKESIKVSYEKPVTMYLFLTVKGSFDNLNNIKIEIKFPNTVNAQIDTLITDEANKLIFSIDKFITSEGMIIIPIDLLKQLSRNNEETYIKPILIKNICFFKSIFIKVTSNNIGLISK